LSSISIKQLLEAGVHFGHQTSRWNPKMKEFIFGERNGIHIIDLQKTLRLFKEAVDFLTELGAEGKEVLFVGTKRQAQEAVEEDATRCGMHFVTNRWLGGLLTNFETVQNSIKRYKQLESMRDEGFYEKLSKKEAAKLERERKKLDKNLRGIRNMAKLPDAMVVIDSDKEAIAVKEANRLGIPVIAIVDTNCDPDQIDFVIPGNDDALRSVRLFTSTIADAVLAGRSIWDAKVEEQRKAREEAEKREAAAKAAREKARVERAARAAKAKAEAEAAAEAAAAEAAAAKAKAKKSPEAEPAESAVEPVETTVKSAAPEPVKKKTAEPAKTEAEPAAAEEKKAEPAVVEEKKAEPKAEVTKKPAPQKSAREKAAKEEKPGAKKTEPAAGKTDQTGKETAEKPPAEAEKKPPAEKAKKASPAQRKSARKKAAKEEKPEEKKTEPAAGKTDQKTERSKEKTAAESEPDEKEKASGKKTPDEAAAEKAETSEAKKEESEPKE